MGFDPYTLHCPVHLGPATATPEGRCPVCDADLSPLVRWRLHAADLYQRALDADRKGQPAAAQALAEESLSFAPDLEEAQALLGRLPTRPARPRRYWMAGLGLAGLAALAALGGYGVGRAHTPQPEVVRVPVTVMVTAVATPTAGLPALPPTLCPTPAPTPAPPLCPGLAQQVRAAWAREPGLALARLEVEAQGCRVRITGQAPTAYLLARAEAAARQAGAEAVDSQAVALTRTHQVRPGDNLWTLAGLLYGDHEAWRAICAANASTLPDPATLPVGTRLALPASAAN